MDLKNLLPKRISRKKIYSSKWLNLNVDQVLLPSGKLINEYHVLDFKSESVVVLLLNSKKEICFIKSPRYTTQSLELELPSGIVEDGEDIIQAGIREVMEETGYTVTGVKNVYSFYPSNAISNQKSHVLTGKLDGSSSRKDYNHDEVNEIFWLHRDQIIDLIKNKLIKDAFALIPLLLYLSNQIE